MIKSSFNRLKPNDFVAQVEQIIVAMTGNTVFPEPWPAPVPALAQIQADLATFQAALTATQSGDKTRIVPRNAARSAVSADLSVLASYLMTMSAGDDGKLATTGFPLKQTAVRSRLLDLPPPPANLDLERGPLSGSLTVRARPVPSVGGYEVQMTAADPTVEANWAPAGSFKNCGRITLQGLTPGKVYSVRIRALGSAGPGAWATSPGMMVV